MDRVPPVLEAAAAVTAKAVGGDYIFFSDLDTDPRATVTTSSSGIFDIAVAGSTLVARHVPATRFTVKPLAWEDGFPDNLAPFTALTDDAGEVSGFDFQHAGTSVTFYLA